MSKILSGKYKIIKKVGGGSFGQVFIGQNIENKEYVAIKVETVYQKDSDLKREKFETLSIFQEYSIYCKINELDDEDICVPRIYAFNRGKLKQIDKKDAELSTDEENDSNDTVYQYHCYLVMQLLGPSIGYIRKKREMNTEEVYDFAIQSLKILRKIHELGYVHRDLKPENFVYGIDQKNDDVIISKKVYLIDFGLAKVWKDELKKFKYEDDGKGSGSIVGTARYMSIPVHESYPYARRDDMESLAYILLYLYKGSLPWQGIKKEDKKEHLREIKRMKRKSRDAVLNGHDDILCNAIPKKLKDFMIYSWKIKPTDEPNYDKYISLFSNADENEKKYNDDSDSKTKKSSHIKK